MEKIYDFYKNTKFTKSFKLGKHSFKLNLNISLWIKTLIILISLSAFFVGALDFQATVTGIGTPVKGGPALELLTGNLVIPGVVLSLLFGTASLVAFGLVSFTEKKFGKQVAARIIILLIVFSALALFGMVIGAIAYTSGK